MDLKVTLIKSVAHRLPKQRKIVKALGLGKVNSTVVLPDNAATRGALLKIAHLISVEKLNYLDAALCSRRSSIRVCSGTLSGYGKTAGRGQKGQLARQGGHTRLGFEGGQMPLFRTMPKRGFNNVNRKEYAIINLDDLNKFEDGSEVTIENLKENGLVKKELSGVKLLANGELKVKLTVKVNKASEAAKKAVEAAGGTVEVI